MRVKEITESVGGTCAGGIAPVAMPMGEVITRAQKPAHAKYQNSAPKRTETRKKHAKR